MLIALLLALAAVADNSLPCGSPVFYGVHAEYNHNDGSFNETVRVALDLADGERLWGDFGYPWRYTSEKDNPFSKKTSSPKIAPIMAQLSPEGFDVSDEPSAVQLTLKYTTPSGTTIFAPCPPIGTRFPALTTILQAPYKVFR